MTIMAIPAVTIPVSSFVRPPKVAIRFRLLREGEVTTTPKLLRIYRDWDTMAKLELAFWAEPGNGEFTQTYHVDLATLLEQGEWLACGLDEELPRRTRAVYLSLTEAGTYTYNISSGEGGGGNPGQPATVGARVRVDGSLADREVVVLERPNDGQWRLAGYGPTPQGEGVIDVRVTEGTVYALGLDDWGTVYTPSLAVLAGQRIRPLVYAGWLYEITEPGTLPSTEPQWWPAEADNASRPLGTARAIAVRYYRPLAHGPIPVEMI